ncbi:MAG: putative selenium-dependent hydroxylase accessory protein YqeC [Anaerolineaceae bacterium]|nr:putative selenium-dependent hydroxylase accessory protein YqeC [Anaerolineaceae bacterium]
MKLVDAIRLKKNTLLAFVGGGGKTTAMFQLARQFESPVIVTTTTHLAVEQSALADIHFALEEDAPFPDLVSAIMENHVILITGLPHPDGRLGSVPPDILIQLKAFVDQKKIPLLIEADGSRMLPIKAPAEKEPVIPGWVNAVVVVVGFSCLGALASDQTIHRFQNFSKITDIKMGNPITTSHIEKMFLHPDGGFKGIPETARRIVLLNQVDDDGTAKEAIILARSLVVGGYDAALVASLKPLEARGRQNVSGVLYCAEKIAGIILAAGGATRYGKPKSLLVWRGESLIRHVAKAALAAGLDPLIVVLGATVTEIKDVLGDLPVQFVENRDWETGQSSSLRVGVREAQKYQCGGAIILQADQPLVPVELLSREMELHATAIPSVVIPRVGDHPSSPVLFDKRYFGELLKIEGDQGGRALFSKFPNKWLVWETPLDLTDIDTPEDYQQLLDMDS